MTGSAYGSAFVFIPSRRFSDTQDSVYLNGNRQFRGRVTGDEYKDRTLRCVVRYTRKKLPLFFLLGGTVCDSWDVTSFKTPNLAWLFLRRIRNFNLTEYVVMVIGCFPFMHLDRYGICGGWLCMRCGFDILTVSFPFAGSKYRRKISRFKEHNFCGILSIYLHFWVLNANRGCKPRR